MFEQIISQNDLQFLFDLVLCVIAGFIIGAERESRGKAAGISTHILVITGAMLFTYMSSVVDPASKSRIAAQIVSGIGFLGAGLILKEGVNVRNLTTAASIWVAGAIGMAFGFNFHLIGMITAIAVALTPRVPHINRRSPEAWDTYHKENIIVKKSIKKKK